jgi:small-conductance mechanosensitive channel
MHDKNGRSGKILTMLALIFAIILFIDPGLRILGADLSIILQVRKFSLSVLVIALAVVIWKLYIIAVDRILKKMGQDKKSSVDETYFPIFSMLGKAVLWATGIGTILNIYGLDLTGILISAGIVTLGITLGAQSVLSQMFNGVSLLLTRPFSEGDYLQIGGEVYIVKHVKLMYTEFLSEEKDRIITIPNNTVASATVTNISKYDKAFRLFIYFQIPYGQEVEKVEEVLLQMAEENKYVMHNYNKYKKPILKLIEFQDSGILMRLDVTVVDIAKWRVIESDMKKELYVKLSEAGIEMPFNRLEVTIMNSEVEKSTA